MYVTIIYKFSEVDVITSEFHLHIFTTRRFAKQGICRRRVSLCVCLSVCLSITLQYCIKTAKRRITQIMPQDIPETLVF